MLRTLSDKEGRPALLEEAGFLLAGGLLVRTTCQPLMLSPRIWEKHYIPMAVMPLPILPITVSVGATSAVSLGTLPV